MRTRLRPRAGCPGVADLTLEPAPTAVGCYQHRVGGLPEACGDVPVAGKPQRAGARRQRDVDGDQAQQRQQREPEKPLQAKVITPPAERTAAPARQRGR